MEFPKQIETERLILKGLCQPSFEMATNIYHVVDESRATLREWLPWVDKTNSPEDEYTNYLVDWCQKNWDKKTGFAYLIFQKEDKSIVGCIDIFSVSEQNKSAEIGYWLSHAKKGQGYMTEAVHALEKEAFQQGINRIVIKTDTLNLPSAYVAKRCGYQLEGVLRQSLWSDFHRNLRDINVFAKLKSDLMRQRD